MVEKVNLSDMTPEKLKKLPKNEIGLSWLRLNQWFDKAKLENRAIEDFVNAGKFVLDEMKNRKMNHDETLGLSRAINRLGKMEVGKSVGVSKDDLNNLPEEVMMVPDFISIVGSSVRSDTPNDMDVLYRADSNERGDFVVRWENGHLALRNTLGIIRPDLLMHEIHNPQGSRESQWLPVYHLVLRKSKDELRLVKGDAAASMPAWEDWLPLDKEQGIWLDLGCGQNKADGFIGIDQELYPNSDIKADLVKGIPMNDSSASVVRANHFIEHMPDFQGIMQEIGRVLIDNGVCILTIPSTDGAGAEIHPDHKIFMNKSQFEENVAQLDLFDPKIIAERFRENNGIPCVDIDAILIRKIRIEKISPLQPFVPTKPEMSGFTEAFAVDELAKWAKDRYPIDVEPKWNGFRSVIGKKGDKAELWFEGKMGTDQLDKFPDIKAELESVNMDFVIDTDIGMERNGRRLPRQDLMTFNADKPELEKDDVVIVTLFDLLYRGNEDLSKEIWEKRRSDLEDFFNENLKGKKNFRLSPMRIVKNENELKPAAHWAFGFHMSEGLVAKDFKSVYEQGGTRNWFKLKKVAELKVIVLKKKTTKAGAFNYYVGLIPSKGYDYTNITEFRGKSYIDLGKTFSTAINAKPGDILTITIIELLPENAGSTLAQVGPRVIDIDDTRKEPYSVEQAISISDRAQILQKDLINIVPSAGHSNSEIAFVGASPGRIEMLRSEPLVGPSGETFNDEYLAPLGLKRSDVFITNVVPILLVDQGGNAREPYQEEINNWHEWLMGELDRANAKVIVALGQTAKRALSGEADFVLPHPMAIRRFGDSGEVARKLKQIRMKIDDMKKGMPSVSDVHIPSTNWRELKKADTEGGDETRSSAAVDFWNKNWQNMYPVKGIGEFCLAPTTPVMLQTGAIVNIMSLEEKDIISDDGGWTMVEKIWHNTQNFKVELNCVGIQKIIGSKSHPLLVVEGASKVRRKFRDIRWKSEENDDLQKISYGLNVKWKTMDEIQPGDALIIARPPIDEIPNELKDKSCEFWELIGWYISEGYYDYRTETCSYACITQNKGENLDRILSIIKENDIEILNPSKRKDRPCWDIRIKDELFIDLVKKYFPGKAKEKILPPFIYQLNEDFRRSLLTGLIGGDGTIDKKNHHYYTSSRDLAYGLFWLSVSLNCPGTIGEHREGQFRISMANSLLYPGTGERSRNMQRWYNLGDGRWASLVKSKTVIEGEFDFIDIQTSTSTFAIPNISHNTYQHHWRGLSEEEDKLNEDKLLLTNHSVHGDLRFTAHKGENLWGFSVFTGNTAENRDPLGDRLITLSPDKNMRGTFKLAEPLEWLTIARGKPFTAAPGEPGSTSKTYSKFFEQDHGKYSIGVWKQHLFELFIDGERLKGRYLIEFVPVAEGGRIWLIDKPKDQTPLADVKDIKAEIKDQRGKGRRYIVWSKPGKEPIPIKLSGAKEEGFIMANDLLQGMGDGDDPWKTYSESPKVNKEIYAEIIKADVEKHLVYGIVLEPGGVDAQNDTIGADEIERVAHVYLQDSRVVGDSHKSKAKATVVESYIAPVDFMLGGQKIKKGSWIMTAKINDEKMWNLVKEGKYTGFSIGGYSRRTPVDKPVK